MPRDTIEIEAPEIPTLQVGKKGLEFAAITTLHGLLAFALADFAKMLLNDYYVPNMGVWYLPSAQRECHACLGGSVIAMSLTESGYMKPTVPADFEKPIADRLCALDALRRGEIVVAADLMGIPIKGTYALTNKWRWELNILQTAYGRERGVLLKRKLQEMQVDLREAGL